MKRLRRKIESIIYGEETQGFFSVGSLLYLLSIVYKIVAYTRYGLYRIGFLRSEKLPCKVISVGNISVGGTGKTPMTIYLAEYIHQLGLSVSVISRGYGGGKERTGGIVSDGQSILMGPAQAGDEPYMMAKNLLKFNVPVIIGKERYKSGLLAMEKFNPDVILLDDGFQHLRLWRNIDLVLLDSEKPVGNGRLLPRGILREPLSSLCRGSAFIFTRFAEVKQNLEASSKGIRIYIKDKPKFFSKHIPYIHDIIWARNEGSQTDPKIAKPYGLDFLKSRRVLIFSGIAKNHEFMKTAQGLTLEVSYHMEFEDHHRYDDGDLLRIQQLAKEKNVDFILTTEKDYSRIRRGVGWETDLVVIGVRISFGEDEKHFQHFIKKQLVS